MIQRLGLSLDISDSEDTEADFLDVIWSKVLRVFLLAIHSHLSLLTDFTPLPLSLSESGLKLVCNVNIVYGHLSLRTLKIMGRNLSKIVQS
jgi:hypothetical protein